MSEQLQLPAAEWKQAWNNSKLRFCDVPKEHHVDWLNEQAAWLFKGRRWPLSPTDNMVRHCIHWWPRIYRLMQQHGWWPELVEDALIGYVITWRLGEEGDYELSNGANQAHYAAIVGAALVRRKARYYNLWKRL